MKKILSLMLCLMVLFLMPLAAMAETRYVVTSNGSGVHLRSGPSTDDDVLETVGYGQPVELLEMMPGSPWANVSHNGYYGYMMLRFLSDTKPTPNPDPVPNPTRKPSGDIDLTKLFSGFRPIQYDAVVVPSTPTTFVNMRWAPTKGAPVRAQYYAGAVLQVKSSNGTWSEVYDAERDMNGFMMSNFLRPANVGDGMGS